MVSRGFGDRKKERAHERGREGGKEMERDGERESVCHREREQITLGGGLTVSRGFGDSSSLGNRHCRKAFLFHPHIQRRLKQPLAFRSLRFFELPT